ncbi:TadE family protein [Ornithinimicrobium pratense]|uniref:Pilus assembly protein n=1 Tax=Ornithinimicrobium pratense TaxID=2593973 RepID=A0A5J6V6X8_9MICO|nr:TadE family protein [Ornithinimicrobium pratense]QFG69054.1 pilus assembly protein [Ornithinimicrobium pratense]
MTWPSGSAERGAAVSEFDLLAGLVSILMLAAMQLAFALHVHNTTTAHVLEGARLGARADSSPEVGAQRTTDLLRDSLPGSGEVQVVEVTAQVRLPVLGPFGPGEAVTVTAHAYAEDQ